MVALVARPDHGLCSSPSRGEPCLIKPDASTGTVVTELPDQIPEKQPVENSNYSGIPGQCFQYARGELVEP